MNIDQILKKAFTLKALQETIDMDNSLEILSEKHRPFYFKSFFKYGGQWNDVLSFLVARKTTYYKTLW